MNILKKLPASTQRALSSICFIAGFASIIGSILIWFMAKSPDPAHGERFGIFVGLWAPTFFILANQFDLSNIEIKQDAEAKK